MKKRFSDCAWEDYLYWQKTDKKMLKKINEILKDIDRHPYEGIGKPEALKHSLSGYWSRRMNLEHRCVNLIEANEIQIAQLRHHY